MRDPIFGELDRLIASEAEPPPVYKGRPRVGRGHGKPIKGRHLELIEKRAAKMRAQPYAQYLRQLRERKRTWWRQRKGEDR